jgi:hypothetical protein
MTKTINETENYKWPPEMARQIGSLSNLFSRCLCRLGHLNKYLTTWLDIAKPPQCILIMSLTNSDQKNK